MRAKVKRIWAIIAEELALLSFELLLVLLLGGFAVGVFIYFSQLLVTDQLKPFDDHATAWVLSFSSDYFTRFMKAVTFLGNRQFIIFPSLLVFIYFLLIKPHRWFSIKIPVVALGSSGFNVLLKEFFNRPRPGLEHLVDAYGLSFPSGHAMYSFSFYGLVVYIVWHYLPKNWLRYVVALFFSVLILLIGTSRVYLGVHYPSDVLAGFAAGFLWLLLSIYIIRYIERQIRRKLDKKAPHNIITAEKEP